MATMPGLPMFGHGQIEGFHEKYGMEYKRSYWNEEPDGHLVWLHEQRIFPLLRRRWLFSGSENFVLYDFYAGESVDENVFAYSNRVGGQRGLVLYHNRYAATAGWIRESAAFAVKSDGDATELRRTTLSEALELVDDDRVYYAFRDHTLDLVFLRNSRELATQGLYAELGEYELHVFTDFREITDDAAGSWGKLCTALNGRGVADLEDELKQLQYADVNSAFRAVLEIATAAGGSSAKQNKNTVAAARRFLTALAEQTGVRVTKQDAALEALPSTLEFLAVLPTLKPSAKSAATLLSSLAARLATPAGKRILLSWLLLKGRKIQLDLYGLDYSLKQANGQATGIEYTHAVLLLQALLAWEGAESTVNGGAAVKRAFAAAACCTFMQVHESGGTEWFHKERFEELLEWFSIVALLESAARKPAPRTISVLLGRLAAENRRLDESAAHAGYRTRLLLRLLEPVATLPAALAPVAVTKKKALKKAEVPGSAGTNPPKAPGRKVTR
jgi:hypothetical protein